MSAILWTTRGNFLAGQRVSQLEATWPFLGQMGHSSKRPGPIMNQPPRASGDVASPLEMGVLPPQGPQWGSMRNVPVCFPVPFGADGETRVEVLEPPLHLARAHGMTDDEHLRAWAVRHIRHMYGHSEATRSIATIKNKAARVPPVWLPPPKSSIAAALDAELRPHTANPMRVRALLALRLRAICAERVPDKERAETEALGCVGTSVLQCCAMLKQEGGNPRVNRRPNLAGQCRQCHDVVSHAVNVLVMLCECYTNSEFVPEPPATLGTFAETVIRELTRVRFAHPLYAIAWFDHVGTTVLRHIVARLPDTSGFLRQVKLVLGPRTAPERRKRERKAADASARKRTRKSDGGSSKCLDPPVGHQSPASVTAIDLRDYLETDEEKLTKADGDTSESCLLDVPLPDLMEREAWTFKCEDYTTADGNVPVHPRPIARVKLAPKWADCS